MSINKVMELLNKRFGKGTIVKASKADWMNIKKIPTGIFSLDIELQGGMPRGRIVEIFGEEDTGKTSLTLLIAKQYQKRGLEVGWIDPEGVYDSKWVKKLGVNEDMLELAQPDYGEKTIDILDAMVRCGEFGLVVLDSVAAVSPMVELESSAEDQQMAVGARLMNKGVRKLHSALNTRKDEQRNKTTVILINQTRVKFGYGNPETTGGGKGIRFGCSLRLKLRAGDWLEYGKSDKKVAIGREVRFFVVKSKISPAKTKGRFDFYTRDYLPANSKAGVIDNAGAVIKYGVVFGYIDQAGGWFSIGKKRLQGEDKLKLYLKEHRDIYKELKRGIQKDAIGKSDSEALKKIGKKLRKKK